MLLLLEGVLRAQGAEAEATPALPMSPAEVAGLVAPQGERCTSGALVAQGATPLERFASRCQFGELLSRRGAVVALPQLEAALWEVGLTTGVVEADAAAEEGSIAMDERMRSELLVEAQQRAKATDARTASEVAALELDWVLERPLALRQAAQQRWRAEVRERALRAHASADGAGDGRLSFDAVRGIFHGDGPLGSADGAFARLKLGRGRWRCFEAGGAGLLWG